MRSLLACVLLAAVLSGCAHKKHVARKAPVPAPQPPPPAVVAPGYTETGMASWYGHPYHGRAAADGEIYDMEKMVAAHRTLPFNTWVRVLNITSGKSCEVRIIDRGPFIEGRIIDLSHAAARAIDLIGPGVAPVRMEVIRAPESAPIAAYGVQVGAFRSRENAEQVRAQMASRYGAAQLVERADTPNLWRVVVGSLPTEEAATALSDRIQQETGERNAFVVRLN